MQIVAPQLQQLIERSLQVAKPAKAVPAVRCGAVRCSAVRCVPFRSVPVGLPRRNRLAAY